MSYRVKELFYTLQGEGANTGRPAVFCRFSGCNLWSGREEDRSTAQCKFCDTDFRGGELFESAEDLGRKISSLWGGNVVNTYESPLVVFTGGEPLLQLDSTLCDVMHHWCFEVAVETNGTIGLPYGIDWVCVSPKAGTKLIVTRGDELKLVYPQDGIDPEELTTKKFKHFYLQPMDGVNAEQNTKNAAAYCLSNPQWKLSLQTHKLLGLR
jgi:7-carboxy-7-deazaguanine synthase